MCVRSSSHAEGLVEQSWLDRLEDVLVVWHHHAAADEQDPPTQIRPVPFDLAVEVRAVERARVWPCFGREWGPTGPNKAQRQGPRRRVKRPFSLGRVGWRGATY